MPFKEDIDTSGLDIADENLNALFTIDPDQWLTEMNAIREYFNQFGKRLPKQLLIEHAKVVDSLSRK
jgi:phosphoenolpyruvate carboxykinase (GTP)